MKIKLVFLDWKKYDKEQKKIISVYDKEEGFQLSYGNFHSGTTFDAEIDVPGDEKELLEAINNGYMPCFYAIGENK
ncbi:MAG: hypothetical protein PHW73_13460 [Atribacterota bacterium]|nr:hypothetical protein [Atribacterota bacterium]